MPLTCSTKHEYHMNVLNVFYCEELSFLGISDCDENAVEINGVDADNMMQLARNLFCARDKVFNYTKEKERTLSYAKEIVAALNEYITENDKDA